jgi:low temperature requirement protein LtrA
MVVGYVVMRIAMVTQWLRAAREDRRRRATCHVYVATISVVQIGWVVLIFADLSIGDTFAGAAVLSVTELSGPSITEAVTDGTPRHARHIAERYSMLTIIALGEGVVVTSRLCSAMSAATSPTHVEWAPIHRRPLI